MYNLPVHKNCINCGDCCGMIPASQQEIKQIKEYIEKHAEAKAVARRVGNDPIHCPFRDDRQKKCVIYPVRPLICRMFGVCKGMTCKHGSTAEIDGAKFLGPEHDINNVSIINLMDFS